MAAIQNNVNANVLSKEPLLEEWFVEICEKISLEIHPDSPVPPKPLLFRTINNSIDYNWLSRTTENSKNYGRIMLKKYIEKDRPYLLEQHKQKENLH